MFAFANIPVFELHAALRILTDAHTYIQAALEIGRAIEQTCFPYGGGCVPGNYSGTRCVWEIQARN